MVFKKVLSFLFLLFSVLLISNHLVSADDKNKCEKIPDKATCEKILANENLSCEKKSIKFALGLDVLRGNSENVKISSDIEGKWQLLNTKLSRTEFRFSNYFLYSLSDEVLNANKLNMEMLVYHYLRNYWSFFVFTRPSYNEKINLDYRLENGIGVKFDLLQNTKDNCNQNECVGDVNKLSENEHINLCCDCLWKNISDSELSISVAVLWDTYQYSCESELCEETKIKEDVIRLSIRPKFSFDIIDKLTIKAQILLQPALIKTENNLRILVKSELSYDFSPELSFVLKVDGEYNKKFPQELGIDKKWDWTLTNNIRLNLSL